MSTNFDAKPSSVIFGSRMEHYGSEKPFQ